MPLNRIACVVLACVAALIIPAAAQAGGRAEVQGDQLVLTGTDGPDGLIIAYSTLYPDEIVVDGMGSSPAEAQANDPTDMGPGCVHEQRPENSQPNVYCRSTGITTIVVNFGSGDDRLTLSTGSAPDRGYLKQVDMGSGDDFISLGDNGGGKFDLGEGDDEMNGERSRATSIAGGAGNDEIFCFKNESTRDRGALVADGGAGKDRICGGRGDDRLTGGAGDDKIYAGEGDDRLNGSAGDDILNGEDDADSITGGTGEDEIDGGSGSDSIKARDGDFDDVACGSKKDTVSADKQDDLNRCEIVRRR